MFIVVFSEVLDDYFVVPTTWIHEYDFAKNTNNSLNHNQPHLIYFTNDIAAYTLVEINDVLCKKPNPIPPKFDAGLVVDVDECEGWRDDPGFECTYLGHLVKPFSKLKFK